MEAGPGHPTAQAGRASLALRSESGTEVSRSSGFFLPRCPRQAIGDYMRTERFDRPLVDACLRGGRPLLSSRTSRPQVYLLRIFLPGGKRACWGYG